MNKRIGIIVAVVLFIGVLGFLFYRSKMKKQEPKQAKEEQVQDAIPTVDSSTSVGISSKPGKKEITLKIFGIPTGTTLVDYELSYQTKAQGTQGVIGTVTELSAAKIEKEITLGTCSSGKCVYHEVTGPVQVTIKFSGDYGEKVYDKRFFL